MANVACHSGGGRGNRGTEHAGSQDRGQTCNIAILRAGLEWGHFGPRQEYCRISGLTPALLPCRRAVKRRCPCRAAVAAIGAVVAVAS